MNDKPIKVWLTWTDIRRGLMVLVLIIVPAVILSSYLPGLIKDYQISGELLWELKKKGVPDEIIQPMLKMRGQSYFFKNSVFSEVKKQVPTDLFEKYEKMIEGALVPIQIDASKFFFLPLLAVFYFIIWWFLRYYETRGWF